MLNNLGKRIKYMYPEKNTDRPIIAAIIGDKHSLIVDSGNSSKHARMFLNEIEKEGVDNLNYLVLTHWHWDHILGIGEFNLCTIAHIETKKQMEKMIDYKWDDNSLDKRVKNKQEIEYCAECIKKEFDSNEREEIKIVLPNIIFEKYLEIDLGGVHCIVEHVGGDHSKDSSIIYVPEEKTIFIGDCDFVELYNGPFSYNLENVKKLFLKLNSYDAKYYVFSHIDKPFSRQEFKNYTDKIIRIGEMVKNSSDKLDTLEDINDIEIRNFFIEGIKKEN